MDLNVNKPRATLLYSSIAKPIPLDGVSVTTRDLVPNLCALGLRVLVATTDSGLGLAAYRDLGENLHVFPRTFAKPIEVSLGLVRRLPALVRQVDVCHFNGFFNVATVLGSLFARWAGKPYVISPVGNCVPSFRDCLRRPADFGKRVFFFALAKTALENAAAIVCTSGLELQRMSAVVRSDRLVLIPPGSHAEDATRLSSPPPDVRPPYVVFLGRLSREKSLVFLFDVWAEIHRLAPDALLVIAGNDDFCPGYADELVEKARQLSLLDSVRFVGSVMGASKHGLLAGSACMVLPSVRESFGQVVGEALTAGTPVVASTGTPWRAVAEANLGDWIPLEKDLWVACILAHLRRSGDARAELARNCKAWTKANLPTWRDVAALHREVYAQAIEKRLILV